MSVHWDCNILRHITELIRSIQRVPLSEAVLASITQPTLIIQVGTPGCSRDMNSILTMSFSRTSLK